MADEITQDTADKPLAHLAEVEHEMAQPEPETAPLNAAERLRAFEDEHFGVDTPRIQGRVERGIGSPYQDAAPEIRAQYEKLERLIETEKNLSDAHAALLVADAEHDAALAAVEVEGEHAAASE